MRRQYHLKLDKKEFHRALSSRDRHKNLQYTSKFYNPGIKTRKKIFKKRKNNPVEQSPS
jgi:hypothetical protein